LLVFFLTILSAVGCTEGPEARTWGGTVLDSAGVRMVHNPETGLWCAGDEWTFTEELKIGEDVGDPSYEFGRIAGIQVGREGSIFVLDQMASEIRVFDRDGRHARTFGKRGEGPGELSSAAAGLFLMADGSLVVPDLGNSRISWMAPDGGFIRSVAASYATGFPVRWDSDERGSVLVQRRAMGFNEDPALNAGDPLVRIDPAGGEEMLVLLPKARTVWMEGATPRFKYFETEPTWDLGSGGVLLTAMTQEYRIEVRDGTGALRSVITRPWVPRAVSSADRNRFEMLLREALGRMDLSPGAIDRQIRNLSFGETFPAFNRLMAGPDGTILAQQVEELGEMETLDLSEEMSRRLGSSRWDVFDPEGRFLGPVELPPRFTPMVWETQAVYGRWLDDLDRAHVLKLRIHRPPEGLPGDCR